MEIRFSGIIPDPIPEKDIFQSQIWNRDFSFTTGEKVLVYADSGKGKTTFINIIFGIRKDYKGDIYIDDRNIRDFSSKDISKLRKEVVSIVPQGLSLFDELTVLENIEIKNRILNFHSSGRIISMLEELGLKGFEKKKTATLSFGQKQRVAIIRALCQKFEFLLLDEAFSHIDRNNTKIAKKLIMDEAARQNAGIIMTSLEDYIGNDYAKMRI